MNSRLRLAALAAIVAFTTSRSTDAAVVVGLVLDPATTAGSSADVNSIYSGLGTWHLFAVDDNDDDFGISSYNIDLTGATAIRHTSPSAFGIEDANGCIHDAGFNTLRSANGSIGPSSIQASQPLPDQSPFLITGFGQQTGSIADVTGGATSGSITSPSWGAYNTISPLNGKNWFFLGEGKYDQGLLPSIAKATFTVYDNRTTFSSKLSPTAIVPEPITPTLLTPEYLAHLSAPPPPPAPIEAAPVVQPTPQPIAVPTQPIADPIPTPVANHEPSATVLPETRLELTVGYGGEWMVVRETFMVPGIAVEAGYDIELSLIDLMPAFSGLQFSMITGMTGLRSFETFGDGGLIHPDLALSVMSFNYNSPGVAYHGTSVASDLIAQSVAAGLFDSLATIDATSVPEPTCLALAIFWPYGLLASRRRRR